jgi:hypothetical protein
MKRKLKNYFSMFGVLITNTVIKLLAEISSIKSLENILLLNNIKYLELLIIKTVVKNMTNHSNLKSN